MHKIGCKTACILILILTVFQYSFSQPKEFIYKSVFISKFSSFITWPESKTDSVFTVSIINQKNYYQIMSYMYSQKKINNKKVVIHNLSSNDSIPESHVIILGNLKDSEAKNIIDSNISKSCLIISDQSEKLKQGAMLAFYITRNGTIHFYLNRTAFKKSDLKPDFMLIDIAEVVEGGDL